MVNGLLTAVLAVAFWAMVSCQSCTKDSLSNAERNLETASDDYFLCNAEQVFASWESRGDNQAQVTRILLARWNHAYSRIPTPSNLIRASTKEKQWATLYNTLYNSYKLLADSNFKAPRVQEYPGDVDSSTRSATVTATVKVTPQADDESHATGLYLPAGSTATVTMLTSVKNYEWYLEIGCQSDNPDAYFITDPWKRPQFIYRKVHLWGSSMKVYSAYGGPIFIRNSGKSQSPLSITISNVVEGPYLNLRDSNTVSQWSNRLYRTGGVPWGVVEGDMISFCVPTRLLKKHSDVQQLRYVLQDNWDKIVKLMYEFVGDSWKTLARRERVVFDVTPSNGYMHAGYPIVATEDEHLTEEALNAQVIKSLGAWGTIHELGHNRQFSGYNYDRFTFSRVIEVTNNVLVAFIRETMWNFPIYSRIENDTLRQHIRNGAPFSEWKVWLALPTYIQMAQHFGWGTISQWMQTYTAPGTKQPPTDQDQIDAWAERMCTVTGMNIIPMFDYWNIPVSKAVKDRQYWQQVNGQWQARPCFLPVDWITQLDGGARYRQIHANFGNKCATTPLKYQRYTKSVDTSIYLRNTVEVSVQRSG